MQSITLTGGNLTVDQISLLVHDDEAEVVFEAGVHLNVSYARAFLDEHLHSKVIYGVNTGFGPMASHLVGKETLTALQRNLIHSHAVGMGQPVPYQYVLAAMLVRLNTLSMGRSGVSVELLEQLRAAINHRIVPVVPEQACWVKGRSGSGTNMSLREPHGLTSTWRRMHSSPKRGSH